MKDLKYTITKPSNKFRHCGLSLFTALLLANSYSANTSPAVSTLSCLYDDGNNRYQIEYIINGDGHKEIISSYPDNMDNPLEKLAECIERTNIPDFEPPVN